MVKKKRYTIKLVIVFVIGIICGFVFSRQSYHCGECDMSNRIATITRQVAIHKFKIDCGDLDYEVNKILGGK